MFPERAVLYMALAETPWITTYEENAFDFWVSMKYTYSLDMSLLADLAVSKYKGWFYSVEVMSKVSFIL